MQPRVTAILVARNGARHLERTLDALKAQTRQPDVVITVDCGSTDATGDLLASLGPTHLLAADADLSFGQAIAAAVRTIPAPESDHEMLWLLAQDSAPEPGALSALLGELEIAPSVACAGSKVMEWDEPDYIREFGQSITPLGATVTLVESELDQAQHDGLSDVLAVSAAGMLVRHTVWHELGGFDPALPVVDDSLDFCIRTRLAGYRVSVVAAARVASAGDGVAGPNGSYRGKFRRRRLRASRAAQLHRRLVYAPAWAVPLHWLSLVPLALVRCIWQLLRKEPGAIVGEFSAAFATAFRGMRVAAARKRLAATRKLGWAAIATLRVPSAEVRRRRALQKEASLMSVRGTRAETRFVAGGGAWTVLAAAVAGIAVLAPLLGARTLTGGGLLPLEETPGDLWRSMAYGSRDIGLGFSGAADPFAAVLAVLGSITFWDPSYSLVLLYFLAFPLAAAGAWMAASRLTDRPSLRATAAVLWVLAPTFLSALAAGRPAAILVHLLLPWLFFAGHAAARSWSASAAAALLFAAIVACAPSLVPALLIGWLICVALSGRSVMRYLGIPLPALALAAPLLWEQGRRGNWLALLADPGAPVPGPDVPAWQLALGIPSGELGGWAPILGELGVQPETGQLALALLLAPLALMALIALFLPGARTATVALVTALLGLLTAVAASHLFLTAVGDQEVNVWPGSGLSLYWLGLVGGAILTLRKAGGFALAPAVLATVALLVAVSPLAASQLLGTSDVAKGIERTLPAFIAAEAQADPRVGTLRLVPQADGGIQATVIRGAGSTLNDQSTLYATSSSLSEREEDLATLTGNLVSRSGLDAAGALSEFGIRFALLQPPVPAPTGLDIAGAVTPEAVATTARATTALDGNPAFAFVGDTSFGQLWRTVAAPDPAGGALPTGGGAIQLVSLVVAAVVVGATILLSIPTGAGREAVRQANREAIRQAARTDARSARRSRGRPVGERAAQRAGRRRRGGPEVTASGELLAPQSGHLPDAGTAAPRSRADDDVPLDDTATHGVAAVNTGETGPRPLIEDQQENHHAR